MSERRYGAWAGMPEGVPEDKSRCVVEVSEPGRGILFHQCYRSRGHGTNGLLCKQHANMEAQGRHLYIPKMKNRNEHAQTPDAD